MLRAMGPVESALMATAKSTRRLAKQDVLVLLAAGS